MLFLSTLWHQIRTDAISHTTLQGFQAEFNSPQNGIYQAFHNSLDALIIDVLKKAAESRRNNRLNPDTAEEEEGEGDDQASRDETAIARPQPTIHEEKPIRIIFITTTAATAGQARQLPWIIRGNATPNKTWLAVLKNYTLQELGEAASRYSEDDEHPQ